MPAKVVDASVLAAIAFGEPEADEARLLIGNADLYAPMILAFELTNIAWKKARRWPEHRHTILQALALTTRLDIHWTEVNHVDVFWLAVATGLSAYDASYVYLARHRGTPLVTFDRQLRAAIEDAAL